VDQDRAKIAVERKFSSPSSQGRETTPDLRWTVMEGEALERHSAKGIGLINGSRPGWGLATAKRFKGPSWTYRILNFYISRGAPSQDLTRKEREIIGVCRDKKKLGAKVDLSWKKLTVF